MDGKLRAFLFSILKRPFSCVFLFFCFLGGLLCGASMGRSFLAVQPGLQGFIRVPVLTGHDVLLSAGRFPAWMLLASLTPCGVVLVPVLMVLRGYALGFAHSVLIPGGWLLFRLLALPGLLFCAEGCLRSSAFRTLGWPVRIAPLRCALWCAQFAVLCYAEYAACTLR